MSELVFHHIKKTYQSQTVLDSFSMSVSNGERVCLLGPSGSGKTTVLRLLLGLEAPDSGTITGRQALRFSAVFQENRLCEQLTAEQNLTLVLPPNSPYHDTAALRAEIEKIGLSEYRSKPVSALSGGMKRRVAILRALLAPSDIVVMDEPFKELDAALRARVLDYVAQRLQNRTFFLVTHEPEDAAFFHARVITLPQ